MLEEVSNTNAVIKGYEKFRLTTAKARNISKQGTDTIRSWWNHGHKCKGQDMNQFKDSNGAHSFSYVWDSYNKEASKSKHADLKGKPEWTELKKESLREGF